jgi:hypothetical protein
MQLGLPSLIAALLLGQNPQPTHQTANFVVQAANPEIARLVADAAESCRADLGKLWLEKELPDWPAPCHIYVTIDADRTAGRTDISFSRGKVLSQRMEIKGAMGRVLKGVLPHELTHVLFAHYFGAQPPRWADEGGAILSEDDIQGDRQRQLFRKILLEERSFSLRRLLGMRQYPDDLTCLYAQGHSVSHFLVAAKSRRTFLAFVGEGLQRGWDKAARDQYGYQSVEELEKAWLGWVAKQLETNEASVPDNKAEGRGTSLSLYAERRPSLSGNQSAPALLHYPH